MRRFSSASIRQSGFTLVELGVVLIIIGALTAGFSVFAKKALSQQKNKVARYELQRVVAQLLEFSAKNFRLPCPDAIGDGLEDCSNNSGTYLPYKTLLMSQPPALSPGAQIVYRPSPDLIARSDGDAPLWYFSTIDRNDFCLKITQSMRQANTLAEPTVVPPGQSCQLSAAGITNPAVILAESGRLNADGSGGLFDGHNGASNNCFESPEHPMTSTYDDQVFVLGKARLAGEICR